MMPLPPKDPAKPWEAIDIFLFSNGQQYSPPRKYHLRNEELVWWDATLTYLGRAHYGSLHSTIDIYTINGTKVQTPMELSNGAAYVAVVPPDDFISAGYEKYLVKASRSWEKSLQKRAAESLQTSKAGVEQLVEEVINGNHQMETPLPHAGSPGNLPASPQDRKRNGASGRSSFFSRRISSNSKPPETKKKLSNIPTPQATQNKNNLNTRTSTDPTRSSFKRKESDDKNSKKIISRVPKPIKNGTVITVSEVITSSLITTKDLQIQNNEKETTVENVTASDKEVMFYKNLAKEDLSSHFDVKDQVPVTNDDAGLKKMISQTHLMKISEESLTTEDVLKNVIKHVVERVFTFKSKTELDNTPNQAMNKEYTLDVVDTRLCPSSCNRNSDSENSADKIVTIIKKGDTINLKVNIEVINTEAGKSPAGDSNLNKPEPLLQGKKEVEARANVNEEFKESPTLKPKHYNQGLCFGAKPSQVVVVQCACTYKDHPTAFSELHAASNTSKHLGKNNTKYILVPEDVLKQYQCCSCAQKNTGQLAEREEQNKRPEETTVEENQPLVCLSSIKITTSTTCTQTNTQTNTERVNCNEPVVKVAEHKEVIKLNDEIMLTRTRSATVPVIVTEDPHFSAQTDSFIKHLDHHDIKRHSCIKPETAVDETKKVHKEKILVEHKVEAPDERETIRNTDQKHVEPARNEPEYVITKTYFDPSLSRREYIVTKRDLLEDTTAKQKPSYIVKRQEDPKIIPKDGHKTEFLVIRKQQPKDSVDVSTQTDWCDTLLQTRVNEDGHYSFHLPTLQLLREYKL